MTQYLINDKNKLKYYSRCPNCNFLLNDENEIKKNIITKIIMTSHQIIYYIKIIIEEVNIIS